MRPHSTLQESLATAHDLHCQPTLKRKLILEAKSPRPSFTCLTPLRACISSWQALTCAAQVMWLSCRKSLSLTGLSGGIQGIACQTMSLRRQSLFWQSTAACWEELLLILLQTVALSLGGSWNRQTWLHVATFTLLANMPSYRWEWVTLSEIVMHPDIKLCMGTGKGQVQNPGHGLQRCCTAAKNIPTTTCYTLWVHQNRLNGTMGSNTMSKHADLCWKLFIRLCLLCTFLPGCF